MAKIIHQYPPAEGSKTGELIESNFKALSVPAAQLATVLRNNLGSNIRPFDLDRVKVPAGGSTTWEVPTLRGVLKLECLEGIILHQRDSRSYWAKKYGGGSVPPDCASSDMQRGVGKPGGDCLRCPFSQFGTAVGEDGKPGRGQACKHVRLVLLLRQDDMIPLLVPVPPSSVKASMKYGLRLAGAGLPYQTVVSQLRLTKTKNATGVEYSQIDFALGRQLKEEEVAKAILIAEAMREVFSQAEIVEADVAGA
jgi:hypothetical protein